MNIDVDSPNLKGNLDTWDYSFSSDIVTEIWQDKNIWWRKKSLHSWQFDVANNIFWDAESTYEGNGGALLPEWWR